MTVIEGSKFERITLKLTKDTFVYPLPDSSGKFIGIYVGGIRLSPKTDGVDEWEWDFEIQNDTIKFSRVFICLLDWEQEEDYFVDIIFGENDE